MEIYMNDLLLAVKKNVYLVGSSALELHHILNFLFWNRIITKSLTCPSRGQIYNPVGSTSQSTGITGMYHPAHEDRILVQNSSLSHILTLRKRCFTSLSLEKLTQMFSFWEKILWFHWDLYSVECFFVEIKQNF